MDDRQGTYTQSFPAGTFVDHVVSHDCSQYDGTGGISACGIVTMNCARILLTKEREGTRGGDLLDYLAKEETMQDILAICSSWSTSAHLDVEDILQAPIFSQSLCHICTDFGASGARTFTQLLHRVQETSMTHQRSSCVVITRPPEIIACFYLICPPYNVYAIFDSHPRPGVHPDGAAFVLNSSTEAAVNYLSELLRYDRELLADKDVQWQAQLLSQVSGHVFVASDGVQDNAQYWKSATMDASLKWLAVQSEFAAFKASSQVLADEVSALRRTVERLEHNARAAAAAARRKSTSSARTTEAQSKDHSSSLVSALWQQGTHALGFASSRPPSTAPGSSSRGNPPPVIPQVPPSRSPTRSASSAAPATSRAAQKARAPLADPNPPDDFAVAVMHQCMYDEEDHLLALERQQLSTRLRDCGICSRAFAEGEITTIDGCRHTFCRSCLRNHVANQLTARPYSVLCPGCIEEGVPGKMSTLSNSFLRDIGIRVHDQYSVDQV